jgi:lanthionine synthetase-like protein
MIDPSRHVPLRAADWNADEASTAIGEIIRDALAHFDPDRFWPAHPLDGTEDGHSGVYMGAAGMMWALDYLGRVGAAEVRHDFRSCLGRLLDKTQTEMAGFGDYRDLGSLHFGDLGTALVVMRLSPSTQAAEIIAMRAEANTALPVRELMWGMPGSMLACLTMDELTGEPRWRAIYEAQAERLLADLPTNEAGPVWTQDLYGQQRKFLGPVHGYAGNMIALMRGWQWLSDAQRALIADVVPRTLGAYAWRSETGTTWHAVVGREQPPSLCQHCHGAPGMVTTFADAPFTTPELEVLLREGAQFTWAAGPLAKGSNLCHGTGGNGYAFLKLHRRTGDAVWLERARAFAMTAIAQCRETRQAQGRGRFSLWTGDTGLAIYLWDCLNAAPRFPTVDVF